MKTATPSVHPVNLDFFGDDGADFWESTLRDAGTGCIEWTKSTASHGYGQTWDGVTVRLAHRIAWELARGPIPADLTIDHLCRNRICCNPDHLRLLPNVVNAAGNAQSLRTHCPHGHAYDESNTHIDKRGHRRCRQCAKQRRLNRISRTQDGRVDRRTRQGGQL